MNETDLQPLDGIRVMDFTQAVFGAGATQVLGDLGADVIKIEPTWGDFMRPSRLHQTAELDSAPWLAMNRNKRSMAIDLRDTRCKEIGHRLVRTADVLMHNFRAGRIDKLGFGYDAVRELNPDIVYVDMTAWGDRGPMRTWAGGDMWAQAFGGAVSIEGQPGSPPSLVALAVADQSGALIGALTVLAGLLARGRNGRGQRLQTSLLDAMMSMQSAQMSDYLIDGRLIKKAGRGWRGAFPFGAYTASDGDVVIFHGGDDQEWAQVCGLLGLESLLEDARYHTASAREERRAELYPLLDAAFAKRARSEWQQTFRANGLRCDPCLDYAELFEHPQAEANEQVWTLEHPTRGELRVVSPPFTRNGSRGARRVPPPLIGQHTVEVLQEIGVPDAEIDALLDEGLLRCALRE